MSEKLKIPKVSTQADKVQINTSTTTGATTYTFPAPEVPNTNTPKLVTFRNKTTGLDVTIDRNTSITTQLETGFGAGATAQAGLVVAENAAKGLSVENPKGMALVLITRAAISTLKYHNGTSQYDWGTAALAGTLSQVKLSTPGYFSKVKFKNAKIQSIWHKISHASHHFHEVVDKNTIKPTSYKFTIGGKAAEFSYLGADFGATRLEAKYLNAKTLVWAAKGKGHSNGGHGNSETETHPQNKIENEGHRSDVEKNTPTNIIKIVTTAQTETPPELEEYKLEKPGFFEGIGSGKIGTFKKIRNLTPAQKKVRDSIDKRKWVVAEAIRNGDTAVEIAPKIYLDLTKYEPGEQVKAALKLMAWADENKNNKNQKPTYGTVPLMGPGSWAKIAGILTTAYDTGVQLVGLADFWYNIKYAKTDAEKKVAAQKQAIGQLQAVGGKVTVNPDGSTTVTVDPKNMNAVKQDNLGTTNLQLKFALEKQAKEFKIRQEQNKLLNFSQIQKQRTTPAFTQINNGLGINTQQGPRTGTFGQSLGWTTTKQ